MTARENLLFFGELYGMRGTALQRSAEEILSAVGLSDRADNRVRTFSGGMKRRLNLKVLGTLLVATFFLGTGVHFLHGFQVKRKADSLLRRAEDVGVDGDSHPASLTAAIRPSVRIGRRAALEPA